MPLQASLGWPSESHTGETKQAIAHTRFRLVANTINIYIYVYINIIHIYIIYFFVYMLSAYPEAPVVRNPYYVCREASEFKKTSITDLERVLLTRRSSGSGSDARRLLTLHKLATA